MKNLNLKRAIRRSFIVGVFIAVAMHTAVMLITFIFETFIW
jgi:hypothetical protein